MKNKAFSLIEIIVAVAIIATLSGVAGLKLRGYLAQAKDTKAITSLNTLRTAIQMYQLDNTDPVFNSSSTSYSKEEVKTGLKKLENYLESNAQKIVENPEFAIGGSQTENDKKIKYGGKVNITFINPNSSAAIKNDGFSIWLEPVDGTYELDIKGNKWIEY